MSAAELRAVVGTRRAHAPAPVVHAPPLVADRIVLRKLAMDARIGVYDWEQTAPQPIVLELSFELPASRAADTDHLADTVDYAQVVARLRDVAMQPRQLVEAMAEHMARTVLSEFPVQWLRLELIKLAPIPGAEVGIVIERHR